MANHGTEMVALGVAPMDPCLSSMDDAVLLVMPTGIAPVVFS
jgi:hypothetical protein